jgi:hypothetical protein
MTAVVRLVGKRGAQLMKHRVPRGKRRGIGKALNDSALRIEKLALDTRNAESSQGRNAISGHPVQHLILHDEATAAPAQGRRRLLVNMDIAAQASQCDACG